MEALLVVGQPVERKDAKDIVTGNVVFSVDVSLPGMLRGKVLRSSIPCGKVVRIDVTKARALPGVKAVITAEDISTTRFGYGVKDERIFASERIRYEGEPIAAIAAIDEQTAEEAAELVEVEYEESPGVFDALEAIKDGAPLVHEEMESYELNRVVAREWKPVLGTNILHHVEAGRGDVEQGFAEADHVFEDTFKTRRVHHCYLEPHGCVAKVEGSKITVWTTTQRPFILRAALAEIFGVPEGSVRVLCTKVGGGFGGKNGVRLEHHAVALAMKTGRPVKLVMTRNEEFKASAGSVPATIIVKTGVKRDGTLTARQVRYIWDCGAYSDGLPASNRALKDACGPYKIPHLKATSTLVYTNTLRGCPFRGLGCPESVWACESQMDMMAHRLGMDPVDFRMRNLVENGDRAATPAGEILDHVTAKECLQRLLDEIGPGKQSEKGKDRGLGISMIYKSPTSGGGAVSSATVSVNRDGSVHLLIGSSDVGGGMETVLAQMVAEEFGLDVSDVAVMSGDTAVVPFDHGTYSSRVTVSSGLAAMEASRSAKKRLMEIAGTVLGEDPSKLIARQRMVFRTGAATGVPIEEVLRDPKSREKSLTATGFAVEDGSKGWRFGAQAVEIEVDKESGLIKVLRVVSVHDVGTPINPPLVNGQIEGGVVMGLGYALAEELLLDEGRTINPSFSDYRLPFAQQVPPICPVLLQPPLATGPFGAKGIGEIGIFGIAPAVANALENAVGIRITELPLNPERVLEALESKASRDEAAA